MVHVDLNDRQVGLLVHADDFGVVQHGRRIVLQAHPDAVGFLDHMAVGDDIALADRRSRRSPENARGSLRHRRPARLGRRKKRSKKSSKGL